MVSQPRMEYVPNLPLQRLSTTGLFVVSSLRLWLLARCQPDMPYPDWRAGFMRAGIDSEGAHGFNTFCLTVTTAALEPLRVHALKCPKLGQHEAWTLQIMSLLQWDQTPAARTVFARHCAPSGARLALGPALAFARSLRERRLWLAYHFEFPQPRRHSLERAVFHIPGSPLTH